VIGDHEGAPWSSLLAMCNHKARARGTADEPAFRRALSQEPDIVFEQAIEDLPGLKRSDAERVNRSEPLKPRYLERPCQLDRSRRPARGREGREPRGTELFCLGMGLLSQRRPLTRAVNFPQKRCASYRRGRESVPRDPACRRSQTWCPIRAIREPLYQTEKPRRPPPDQHR